ncbi:MAG TPA: hypothetical protein VFA81_09490 [Burkholderiales bacterium]|nr:hypothetical protein [Burkholderiales bacterium]
MSSNIIAFPTKKSAAPRQTENGDLAVRLIVALGSIDVSRRKQFVDACEMLAGKIMPLTMDCDD